MSTAQPIQAIPKDYSNSGDLLRNSPNGRRRIQRNRLSCGPPEGKSYPRFFVPPDTIAGETAILPPDAAHHARNVLRLRPGEVVTLHDGLGNAYDGTLADGPGKSVIVMISGVRPVLTEPGVRITVVQALPKTSDKVEQVLQHGTEIGAAGFVLFPSERSVARMEARDKVEKRLERWAEIVKAAAEQSGRGVLPTVAWEPRLTGLLPHFSKYERVLMLHESATTPLRSQLAQHDLRVENVHNGAVTANVTRYCVLVGPEGGFTGEEVARCVAANAVAVSLGPRILRTETAALVALSQILFAHNESSVHERNVTS